MNLIVAVPVDEALASFMGKKGSANSITFYNRKEGGDVIVALLPSQDEDKTYALAESLLVASSVVLSTANLDKRFGEALVACSLLDKKVLVTDDNDASALLKDAGLRDYSIVSRSDLLVRLRETASAQADGPVRVDIDKAFPVKGIGTVVLGFVTRGTLRQHDKLFHTSGKEVLVRSMQSQDEDITTAITGTRVGISLKDIGDKEVEKGDLLTTQAVAKRGTLTIEYRVGKMARESVVEGARYGIASNFSYSECTVKSASGSTLVLELTSPFPAEPGDRVLLIRKQLPRIFAAGSVGKA